MEGEGVTMGKAAHYLGAVGTGSKMKLVVNMTMGTMMNSLVRESGGGDGATKRQGGGRRGFQTFEHSAYSTKQVGVVVSKVMLTEEKVRDARRK